MIGRALMRPQRFTDLMQIISHTDPLTRVLRKLVGDGLARKRNDGKYELTPLGRAWVHAALPLLEWVSAHPRNAQSRPRSNDPVINNDTRVY